MSRSEPMGLIPPAAYSAEVMVREAADGIAAGTVRLAHDENADRARIAHADAGAHADHLTLDTRASISARDARERPAARR